MTSADTLLGTILAIGTVAIIMVVGLVGIGYGSIGLARYVHNKKLPTALGIAVIVIGFFVLFAGGWLVFDMVVLARNCIRGFRWPSPKIKHKRHR